MFGKPLRAVVCLFGTLLFADRISGAKVKRVKAGKVYKEHDPVHIVVNKVG